MQTVVPTCPFMSSKSAMIQCFDNCPLKSHGECSLKVIAEELKSLNQHRDSAK